MASYRLFIKPSAVKELEGIPKKDRQRIVRKIKGLSGNPRPAGCEKLSGQDKYRIRQGPYRIVYAINDGELAAIVVKIGHRKEIYRPKK